MAGTLLVHFIFQQRLGPEKSLTYFPGRWYLGESKGVETEAIDLGDNPDPFKQYHKASSGPASDKRPVFGEVRGSDYKEYFGKTIPALCCYTKKGDRAPVEVFPRGDKKLGREYLIEEFLENYIGELEGRIESPEAN